ncbi:carboxypeptidase-like regulatory domain-containing protein [Maribacter halichondriae]|uniref:carboxypeptidase-like regulatory domain-containing protein n=1 Tax=Maribacter halichondriae TaxID=2980554 RepID=UPI002359BE6B|nr:carboxypeptidase-like regulatory domain-containing protein [Maribacter sp. Hal144]
MPTKYFILLCCVLFFIPVNSQEEFILGELYDSKTNEPIAFATIRVKGYAMGVISNQDGGFKVPLKFKAYSEILEISSMGYVTKEVGIVSLSTERINVIRMAPGILELNEVVVRAKSKVRERLTARQIVERAIKNIPTNYPLEPFSLIGYYRDYQYENNRYVNLNESILEVFDTGFAKNSLESTNVQIYDNRKNNDFLRDTLALSPYDYNNKKKIIQKAIIPNYGGNEFQILSAHDAIRNYMINSYSFINRLETDLLTNHIFSKEDDTYFDGKYLYTIKFTKNSGGPYSQKGHTANGTFYISKSNFAIYWMDYKVYDKNRMSTDSRKDKYGEDAYVMLEVKSEYRNIENKMYLNYISMFNKFQVREPYRFQVDEVAVNFAKKCFIVSFSDPVNDDDANKVTRYKIRYKGKRIKVDGIVVIQDEVLLFPKLSKEDLDRIFYEMELAQRRNALDADVLYFEFGNIRDRYGNLLHEPTYKEMDQFREFFVQEVKPNVAMPTDVLFMNKNKPIFKDQPIVRPANFDKYWMNTPLPTIEKQKGPN